MDWEVLPLPISSLHNHHLYEPCSPVLLLVIMTDYILIHRLRPFNMHHLYKSQTSIYWYYKGVNPRALSAWLIGVVPLLPGLIYNINPNIKMAKGILEFYTLGWLDGLVLASLTYFLLNLAFPVRRSFDDGSNVDIVEGQEAKHVDEESIPESKGGDKVKVLDQGKLHA